MRSDLRLVSGGTLSELRLNLGSPVLYVCQISWWEERGALYDIRFPPRRVAPCGVEITRLGGNFSRARWGLATSKREGQYF